MIVYEGIKSTFIDDVNLNQITDKIYDKYKQYFGRSSKSQINSWQNSMQYMRGVLSDQEIPDDVGSLTTLLDTLDACNINIAYLYVSYSRDSKTPLAVMKVSAYTEVEASLKSKGYTTV